MDVTQPPRLPDCDRSASALAGVRRFWHRARPWQRWVLSGGAALAILGILVGSAWSSATQWATAEIATRLERRLGLVTEIEAVTVEPGAVRLQRLSFESPEGDFELTIGRIVLDGDPLALARREEGALRGGRVENVRLLVDLGHPAAERRLAKWRKRLGAGSGSEVVDSDEADSGGKANESTRDHGGAFGPVDELVRLLGDQAAFEVFDARGTLREGGEPRALVTLDDLRIRRLESGVVDGFARVSLSGHEIVAPRSAEEPVDQLAARAEGNFTLDLGASRLRFAAGRIERRAIVATLGGELGWPEGGWRVSVEAELPESRCEDALEAVPAGLFDRADEIELRGRIAARAKVHVDTSDPEATELTFDVEDGCRFADMPAGVEADRFRRPFEQVTRGRGGEVVHRFETGPGTPHWTPIEDVSPFFLQAVLAHEDAGFFAHSGFAVYAMESAIEKNLERERFAFGASTLTMQLAKNLFLTRDKTIARKLREAFYTWWLERHLDKREILELYVNIVEFGPRIFGVREAAAHYFGRQPLDLTPAGSVYLATLLPAPVTRSRQYDQGALWRSTEERFRFLLRHMERKGRLDTVARDYGLRELESFRFHVGDELREVPRGDLGRPGDLPFGTRFDERRRATTNWWDSLFGP